MQLPLEKQFQIMDLLRRGFSVRIIKILLHMAKSTVQDYKKRGPPYFRRYSTNPSVESYPTTLQEENKWLKQKFKEVEQINKQAIHQRNKANNTVQYFIQSNTQKDRELESKDREMESQKQEKEQLRKQVSERDQTIQELTENYTQLDDKYKKLKSEDDQKNQIIIQLDEELQNYKTYFTQVNDSFTRYNKKIKELTEERDKLKSEVWSLRLKQKNAPLKYVVVGSVGFGLGMIIDRFLIGLALNSPSSLYAEGTNTAIGYFQKPQVSTIQPRSYIIDNGKNQAIYTSGIPCSGTSLNNYAENASIGSDAIPHQQDSIGQPIIQGIDSGMTLQTNTFDNLCSGGFSHNYGTGSIVGYAVVLNQQEEVIQPDIQGIDMGVTPVTNNSGSLSSGGRYYNNTEVEIIGPSEKKRTTLSKKRSNIRK